MTLILPPKKDVALKALELFKPLVGMSRANNKAQITRILAVSGLSFRDEKGNYVSFCAATLVFVYAKALAVFNHEVLTDANAVVVLRRYVKLVNQNYFKVSASVTELRDLNPEMFLPIDDLDTQTDILPAWFIAFDFTELLGYFDRHIGMVESDNGDTIKTLEGNTTFNGQSGIIAEKERSYASIWGFFKTY